MTVCLPNTGTCRWFYVVLHPPELVSSIIGCLECWGPTIESRLRQFGRRWWLSTTNLGWHARWQKLWLFFWDFYKITIMSKDDQLYNCFDFRHGWKDGFSCSSSSTWQDFPQDGQKSPKRPRNMLAHLSVWRSHIVLCCGVPFWNGNGFLNVHLVGIMRLKVISRKILGWW